MIILFIGCYHKKCANPICIELARITYYLYMQSDMIQSLRYIEAFLIASRTSSLSAP